MTLPGEDTFETAKKLYESAAEEADFRAAASRAYLAAFQHLRDSPRIGFVASKTGADHRQIIEHLKHSSDPGLQRLGRSRLPTLRALRNHADYELRLPFRKELAEEALDEAADIIFERG